MLDSGATLLRGLAAVVCLAAAPAAQDARPLTSTQQRRLVEEYFKLDRWTAEGYARRGEILAELARVPPLGQGTPCPCGNDDAGGSGGCSKAALLPPRAKHGQRSHIEANISRSAALIP